MLYSALSIGYFGVVTNYTYSAINGYQNTKAPNALKQLRNTIELAGCAFWYSVGWYTIYSMGHESLYHLINLDSESLHVIQALPKLFAGSYLLLKTSILAYRIYQWFLLQEINNYQHYLIIIDILQYCIELSLAFSALGYLSVTLFTSLTFGNVCFSAWCNVVNSILNVCQRNDMNKELDWDLILAQLYFDLSSALLLSLLLLGLLDIGDMLLDAIMCLKASAYIALKTIYDIYQHQGINGQLIFQSVLFIMQFGLGMGLLLNLIVIPESALVSLLIFKILKGSAILVAAPSLAKNAMEEQEVKNLQSSMVNQKDTKDMSIKDYLFFKHQSLKTAQAAVWKNNAIIN
jgi:hypothetical protein